MKHLEKNNILKEPEGYFESLPDRILQRHSKEKIRSIYRLSMAAAAVVVLVFALFVFRTVPPEVNEFEANLEEEVNLYINAGHWNAEDVLSLSEDPNLILDEIIASEWGEYQMEDGAEFEEDLWF